MAVSFDAIPVDLRTPLFYAEIDNTKAGYYTQALRTLIIGGTTVTAQDGILAPVGPPEEARNKYGYGSQLARMVTAFRRQNPTGQLWVYPIKDKTSATTAATGTLTLGGTSTASGHLYLYVAGQQIKVPIPAATAAADAALLVKKYITRTRNSVDLIRDLPVSVSVSGAVVTFTAKNTGTVGNGIDIRLNYGGTNAGETLPPGLTATVVAMASGAGDPTIASALAALGDEPFEYFVTPFSDATNIAALEDFLASRWGPMKQLYGLGFYAKPDTLSALIAYGETRNSPHMTCYGYKDSPTWYPEAAADYAGLASLHLSNDPARTLQTLPMISTYPPAVKSRWTIAERQSLLYSGITPSTVYGNKTVLDRAITTYQVNGAGAEDPSYLDLTTMATLARIVREVKSLVLLKFPRYKLAKDGTAFGAGQAIVTPAIIKAELVNHYESMIRLGFVQNLEKFKAELIVELDEQNPNRMNVLYPPTLVNNLVIFATKVQFNLLG